MGEQIAGGMLKNDDLKEALYQVLEKKHVYRGSGKSDILVDDCADADAHGGRCYTQKSLGYNTARKLIFGKLHLQQDDQGYFVFDVYCRKQFTSSVGVGPDKIPNSNVINTEHTWPQSKFSNSFPKEMQKSDMHHLFPTDSKANGVRGNNEFAEVNGNAVANCGASYSGDPDKSNGQFFEPPDEHKGNVARALFYFSVRYRMPISAQQEDYLRRWHEADSVDAAEIERNEMIFKMQGNRNPFIDHPESVSGIADF
jgi:hypothetical protein